MKAVKKLIIKSSSLTVVLGALFISGSVWAHSGTSDSNYAHSHEYQVDHHGQSDHYHSYQQDYTMHSRRIDMRQHRQASLIVNGIKRGQISDAEAIRLQRQQNRIHRQESLMKADHRLDQYEINRLQGMLDEAQNSINTALHNNDYQYDDHGHYQPTSTTTHVTKALQKLLENRPVWSSNTIVTETDEGVLVEYVD